MRRPIDLIHTHIRQCLGQFKREANAGRARTQQQFQRAGHDCIDCMTLRRRLLPACEGEHVAGQQGAPLHCRLCSTQQSAQTRILARTPRDQIQAGRHHGQQIVEVMRHAARQPAQRLAALRLRQHLLRLLRCMAFADIAGHHGKTDQHVEFQYRLDHHAGQELAAILAQAPAFRSSATIAHGDLKQVCRLAGRRIFARIKTRRMRPHDLGRGVAVKALAGCIPATHVSARIERIDRAIAHARATAGTAGCCEKAARRCR